ncbi:MAG: phosphoribosylformylglycinamidine cyclo-ligase [Phycisphaerales bacterium]
MTTSDPAGNANPQTSPGETRAGLTYADSGVDIEAGDRMVDMIQTLMRRTHGPRVIDRPGGFANLFRLDYNEKLFRRNFRDPVLVACTDGVGSKVKLAVELGVYDTVGIDCVAMCVNDMIVEGAEPLLFLDYIGTNKLDPERMTAIVAGVSEGCHLADCALIGGETAELPDIYDPGDFDLAGFSVGVLELDRAIDSSRVEEGDIVLGLASDGLHSNGFSLVRKILSTRGLQLDRRFDELDPDKTLGEVVLTPTRVYAKPIVRLLRKYTVKKIVSGMAHITGGGLPGNVCRALPEDLDAVIDASSWEVPAIFRFLQKHGGVAEDEMFRVFNMGIGFVLIVRPAFANSVTGHLRRLGETVYEIGVIERGGGGVRLEGAESD